MFITFEGTDGSGKTTALEGLQKYLNNRNIKFTLTREPGSFISKENKKIRKLIVSNDSNLSNMAEAILFSADRRLHLERLIWPALKNNELVLCDRYFDSTFAYQGAGRELGIDKMIDLQDNITEKTYPKYTIYFDVPVEISLARIDSRGAKNRLDQEGEEFFERVYAGYKELIKRFPNRFIVVDATQTPEKVLEDVIKIFEKKILK